MNRDKGFSERDWPEPKPQKDVAGHTKGEWYWDYKDNKPFNLRAKSKHPSGCAVDEHILFIADDFLGENSLNNEADANLIAASPRMYEALKELMDRFNVGVRFPLQSTCDRANQAIAKAEGGK